MGGLRVASEVSYCWKIKGALRLSIINKIFKPLYGKLSWQVEQGYSTFLTFDFGEPHLRIREPMQASEEASEKTRKNLARRFVYVRGDWHLWIYICNWHIFLHGQELANSSSNRRTIRKATLELDGQALTRVTIKYPLISVFEFDLGGKLEVTPNDDYEKDDELWILYEPSDKVFSLRADGQYCHFSRHRTPPSKEQWKPLVIPKAKIIVK